MTLQSFDDFLPLQGSEWQIQTDEGPLSLRLEKVERSAGGMREGGSFSLVFVMPGDRYVDQGNYRLVSNDRELEIFLVPIGPFADGMGHEAIYN